MAEGSVDMAWVGLRRWRPWGDVEILNNGIVLPSVVCPEKCGWHEMVVLENWDPTPGKKLPLEDLSLFCGFAEIHHGHWYERALKYCPGIEPPR